MKLRLHKTCLALAVAALGTAASGMGLAQQPDFIATPFLDSGRVQRVLRRYEPAPLGIYAVLPSNRYIPHRVSVLIEHLARVLGPKRANAARTS